MKTVLSCFPSIVLSRSRFWYKRTVFCAHQFVAIIFSYYYIFLHRHSFLFHHQHIRNNYCYYHHHNITAGNDDNGKERGLGAEAEEPIRRYGNLFNTMAVVLQPATSEAKHLERTWWSQEMSWPNGQVLGCNYLNDNLHISKIRADELT